MGFILDAIGAAASAGGEIMGERRRADMQAERDTLQSDRHEQQAIRMAQFNDELQSKRQETVDRLKRERDELHQKKLTDQGDKIVTQGAEIRSKREVGAMTAGAAGLPSEGEFAGQAIQPSDIENLPPAARKIYEEQGFLPKRTGSGLVADQMTAARSMGADPTLRSDLQKEYATTLGNEQKQAADAQATRKADDAVAKSEKDAAARDVKLAETERANRAREDLRDRQTAAIVQSATIRASRESSAADKTAAQLNLNTTIKTAKDDITAGTQALMLAKKGSPEAAAIQKTIETAQEIHTMAQQALKGTLEAGNYKGAKPKGDDAPKADPKPGPKAEAKPSAIATPKTAKEFAALPSKTRYQAPDGSIRIKP